MFQVQGALKRLKGARQKATQQRMEGFFKSATPANQQTFFKPNANVDNKNGKRKVNTCLFLLGNIERREKMFFPHLILFHISYICVCFINRKYLVKTIINLVLRRNQNNLLCHTFCITLIIRKLSSNYSFSLPALLL